MLDPVFAVLLILWGAALFATAALHKLRAPAEFAAAVAEYRILPSASVRPIALALPLIELTVAVALLGQAGPIVRMAALTADSGRGSRALVALAAAVLLATYGSAIAVNLARGRRDLDCGCGGSHAVIGGWMVARNATLASAMFALCLPVSGRALGFEDIATIGAGFAVAVLLYASTNLLLSRPVPRPSLTSERS